MKPTSRKINTALIFWITGLMLINFISGLAQTPAAADSPTDLPSGASLERQMTGAETHRYKFDLKKDEFFQVRVEQKGVDVVLKLVDPEGKVFATMDSPNGNDGPETLTFVPTAGGSFVLEVSESETEGEKGLYRIKREASRTATVGDRRRVEVERLFFEALTALVSEGPTETVKSKLLEAQNDWRELADEYMANMVAFPINLMKGKSIFDEGMVFFRQGTAESYRTALEKFEESLRKYRELNEKQGMAECLLFSGLIHHNLGESTIALDLLNDALPLAQAAGNKLSEAVALVDIGLVYDGLGEKQRALEFYNKALPILRSGDFKNVIATTLNNIGHIYATTGEKSEALTYYNQALSLFRLLNDKKGETATLNNIGSVIFSSGNPKEALSYFDLALPMEKAMGDKRGEAITLTSIGSVFSIRGEGREALRYYNQALPLSRFVGDKAQEAVILNNIGEVYDVLGDNREALKYYNQALLLFKAVGNKGAESTTLTNIGHVYDNLGEKSEALKYHKLALPMSRAASDKSTEATIITNICAVYNALGNNQEALKYCYQALSLSRVVGEKKTEAATLNNIGTVYNGLGEKQEALKFYDQALSLSRTIECKSLEGRTLSNIGSVFSDLGQRQEAFKYFNQALTLIRAIGERAQEAKTLNNIGNVYHALGERQEALTYYNQALRISQAVEDKSLLATLLNNIGVVNSLLSEQRIVLEYYNQALLIEREVGDKSAEATILNNIGYMYGSLGDSHKGLEYFNRALLKAREADYKKGESITLNNIGYLYFKLGEAQEGLKHYYQALSICRAIGDKSQEAVTQSNLMFDWNRLNNRGLGAFYGKQAVNTYQQLRTNIRDLDKQIQQTYLKTIEDTYRSLADLLIAEGRIAEAEQVLAMLKEEEYFGYLRRDETVKASLKAGIELNKDEKEAAENYEKFAGEITRIGAEFGKLEAKKNALGLGESLPAEEQAEYDRLKQQLDGATAVFNKFLDDLKVKFGQKDARVATVESDTQGLLKRLNQPFTVIISTIVGEDRLNLIVTTADTQTAHTVQIKEADLNKLVAEFRAAVKNPAVDPRVAGKKLYDVLFPATLQKDLENIKADTIVWSLDGTLRYAPMPALSPDGRDYLLERYTSAVITLASRDKVNALQTDRTTWKALGVGVSKGAEVKESGGSTRSFGPLAAVPEELCRVVDDPKKKEFCGQLVKDRKGIINGLMLPDDEFTLKSFQNFLGQAPVVHIASHFNLNAGDETNSYLLLGGGQTFTLVDMKKTNLANIDLLTLSACNTAMTGGAKENGVEVEGFAALAQNRGAKTVLATLWSVADPSTRDAMTEFYRQLETDPKVGKAEALRRAQLALMLGRYKAGETPFWRGIKPTGAANGNQPVFRMDENAPFAHPYYWAPFVLIGNWR